MNLGPMLNAYPNSLGRNLGETVQLLRGGRLREAFSSFYLLPTLFNTDLDDGFSVITYDLCEGLAKPEDLKELSALGLELTCDLILNHLSVLSPQFQDLIRKGEASAYRDFFIDWNRFWAGCGPMTEAGYIHPTPEYFSAMALRKKSLPILMVRQPDGREVPYWNTFYQQVVYRAPDLFDLLELTGGQYRTAERLAAHIAGQLAQGLTPAGMDWSGFEALAPAARDLLESRRRYLGQMDVNVQSPLVWDWYGQVMDQLAGYGMKTIRLDAYTRLHKAIGRSNFLNEPETWDLLSRIRSLAEARGLDVLPEIHATYASGAFRKLAALGCPCYDYFLPGLILDAIDTADASYLCRWANEILRDGLHVVNMLGCHDGIPIRDLRGLLPDERIDALVTRLEARGARRKMLHGAHPEVYQMDTTYLTALGGDPEKLLLARAIQLFMPGKPQIWYVDLLAGENDLSVFEREPDADNRRINRRPYSLEEIDARLDQHAVYTQLNLLKLRNAYPAFAEGADVTAEQPETHCLRLTWRKGAASMRLDVDLKSLFYVIRTDI